MLPPFLIVMNFVTGIDCYTEISGIIPVFKKINDGTPGCRPVIVLPGVWITNRRYRDSLYAG